MYFSVKRDAGHHTRCSFDSRLPSSWYVCCKIVLRLGNNQSHCSKGATRTKQKAGDPNRMVRRVSHLWNSMQNSMSTLRYLFRRPSNPQSEVMSGIVAELLWLIQRFHTPKLIKIPAAKQQTRFPRRARARLECWAMHAEFNFKSLGRSTHVDSVPLPGRLAEATGFGWWPLLGGPSQTDKLVHS